MLNQNERHPAVGRHGLEEIRKRFESASGSADAHDRERKPRRLLMVKGLGETIGLGGGYRWLGRGRRGFGLFLRVFFVHHKFPKLRL
jgi:hypothetical protein